MRAIVRCGRFPAPSCGTSDSRGRSPPTRGSYNLVQRLTYILVIFLLFPLVIWTGLAMSPAFVSAVPSTVTILGGRQSARTLHFLVSVSLVAFLLVHVAMVWFAGFGARVMAMITGAPMTGSQ
jgi:thiosulfate reductase cytochrome b subunit